MRRAKLAIVNEESAVFKTFYGIYCASDADVRSVGEPLGYDDISGIVKRVVPGFAPTPEQVHAVLSDRSIQWQVHAYGRVKRQRDQKWRSETRYQVVYDTSLPVMNDLDAQKLIGKLKQSHGTASKRGVGATERDAIFSPADHPRKRRSTGSADVIVDGNQTEATTQTVVNLVSHSKVSAGTQTDQCTPQVSPMRTSGSRTWDATRLGAAFLIETNALCEDGQVEMLQTVVCGLTERQLKIMVDKLYSHNAELVVNPLEHLVNGEVGRFSKRHAGVKSNNDMIDDQNGCFRHSFAEPDNLADFKATCPFIVALFMVIITSVRLGRRSLSSEDIDARLRAALCVFEMLLNVRFAGKRPQPFSSLAGLLFKIGGMSASIHSFFSALRLTNSYNTAKGMVRTTAEGYLRGVRQWVARIAADAKPIVVVADNFNPLRWRKLPGAQPFTKIVSSMTVICKQLKTPSRSPAQAPSGRANNVPDLEAVFNFCKNKKSITIPESPTDTEHVELHSFNTLPSLPMKSSSTNDTVKYVLSFLLTKLFGLDVRELVLLVDPEPALRILRQLFLASKDLASDVVHNVILVPACFHIRKHGIEAAFAFQPQNILIWTPLLQYIFGMKRTKRNVHDPDFQELDTGLRKAVSDFHTILDGSKSAPAPTAAIKYERFLHIVQITVIAFKEAREQLRQCCTNQTTRYLFDFLDKELVEVWIDPYAEWVRGCPADFLAKLPQMIVLFAFYKLPNIVRYMILLTSNVIRWSASRHDILYLIGENSRSLNDVFIEHINAEISSRIPINSAVSFTTVKLASLTCQTFHSLTKQLRSMICGDAPNESPHANECELVESRAALPKYAEDVARTKHFLVQLFRIAAATPTEPNDLKFECLDKHSKGIKQLQSELSKLRTYTKTVVCEEQTKIRNQSLSDLKQLLVAQPFKTLKKLAKRAKLIIVDSKKANVMEGLEQVAGLKSVDAVLALAGDDITIKDPDFRDCHALHAEGLAKSDSDYFTYSGASEDTDSPSDGEDDEDES